MKKDDAKQVPLSLQNIDNKSFAATLRIGRAETVLPKSEQVGTEDLREGDYVKVGTVIGKRNGGYFEQNIHSTVSGTVVGTVKKFHRSGKLVDFIKTKSLSFEIHQAG